jgi:hypothetical protein
VDHDSERWICYFAKECTISVNIVIELGLCGGLFSKGMRLL